MPVNNLLGGQVGQFSRNRYFYGKLMTVSEFEKDQQYHSAKHRFINRHVLGYGVVGGLGVGLDPDSNDRIVIQPGLAINQAGCEIYVPDSVSIDPHQLTNDDGEAVGDLLDSGEVEICLALQEVADDPVPSLVPDCENSSAGNCQPCTIREEFRILVRPVDSIPLDPPTCPFGDQPVLDDASLHRLICERLSDSSFDLGNDSLACIPLARVSLPLQEDSIDDCRGRPLVYKNSLLLELSLCLFERLNMQTQQLFLRYVRGDGQVGESGQPLSGPLVVQVMDGSGNPVEGVAIQFQVLSGGGSIMPEIVQSNTQGLAEAVWSIGPNGEDQRVAAQAAGSVFTVGFVTRSL